MVAFLKSFSIIGPLSCLAIAGCAPAEDSSSEGEPPEEIATASANPNEAVLVSDTGWLSVGADGSVLTTFIDQGGRYRDFRNGAASDAGTWERRPDGAICFSPDEGTGDCWSAGALDADGSTLVTSQEGKRVAIKRITYTAPPVEDETQEAD